MMGSAYGDRHRPRAHRRRAGDRLPAARGRQPRRRARRAGQHHRVATGLKLRETKEVMNTIRTFAAEDAHHHLRRGVRRRDGRRPARHGGRDRPRRRARSRAAQKPQLSVAEDRHRQRRHARSVDYDALDAGAGGVPQATAPRRSRRCSERRGQVRHPGVPAQAGGLAERRSATLRARRPRRRPRGWPRDDLPCYRLQPFGRKRTDQSHVHQRTIKRAIKSTGVGLHTGAKVVMTLRPAQPDTGIVFRRIDLPRPVDIRADARAVADTRLCSALEGGGAKVATVEHLMSALAGLGHRQPVRRPRRARGADHGRQRRAVRVPAAVGGDRGAARAEALLPHPQRGRGARRRQVGALRAVRRLQALVLDRVRPSGVRALEPVADASTSPRPPTRRRSRARAPSASCRTSRRCATPGSPSAAAWTTPSCSTSTAC